jgi:hypothetical protein
MFFTVYLCMLVVTGIILMFIFRYGNGCLWLKTILDKWFSDKIEE